ncbi:MAG TPA: hypothetical protein VHV80_00775 [Steroidobacteraceae bacterium]|nr:hypothetical protein [Steroidobacteraceae bacterium]
MAAASNGYWDVMICRNTHGKRHVFGVVAHDERGRMSIDRGIPHPATDREARVFGTHH